MHIKHTRSSILVAHQTTTPAFLAHLGDLSSPDQLALLSSSPNSLFQGNGTSGRGVWSMDYAG